MDKKVTDSINKMLQEKETAFDSKALEEMPLIDAISFSTLKRMKVRGNMTDILNLAKLLGEVDDNKVILTPIDKALEDAKVDVDN